MIPNAIAVNIMVLDINVPYRVNHPQQHSISFICCFLWNFFSKQVTRLYRLKPRPTLFSQMNTRVFTLKINYNSQPPLTKTHNSSLCSPVVYPTHRLVPLWTCRVLQDNNKFNHNFSSTDNLTLTNTVDIGYLITHCTSSAYCIRHYGTTAT